MSYEEDVVAWAKSIRDFLQEQYEAKVISNMEVSIAETARAELVPPPNTTHPALSHAADFVRRFNGDTVLIAVAPRRAHACEPEDVGPTDTGTSRLLLTKRLNWALAPYVPNDPRNEARYVWPSWVDSFGRCITGDSTLVWKNPNE